MLNKYRPIFLSMIVVIAIFIAMTPVRSALAQSSTEHHHSNDVHPHMHRTVGLSFEAELALRLDDLMNDEALYAEVELGVPSWHTWIGVGLGSNAGIGISSHPDLLGLLLGVSLHVRPEPLELTVRGYYDRNLPPGEQLVRLEVRALTTWIVGPVIRGVANCTPSGWNLNSEETRWEGTVSTGVAWQVDHHLTAVALLGVALDERPHAVGTFIIEWRPPLFH